ncbi:hypothetical protein BJV78DRAFT_1122180 [Lactifluus subvellereus]|nr:hypothetical protein BJV78DRAFT_1122180 [Lactifluus subvellereus]
MLEARGKKTTEAPAPPLSGNPEATKSVPSENPSDDSPPTLGAPPLSKAEGSEASPPSNTATRTSSSPGTPRRWSFQSPFGLLRKHKPSLSNIEKHGIRARAASEAAATAQVKRATLSHADRRAKQSALVVRSLIVGQDADGGGLARPRGRISRAQLSNVKAQLLQPKTANRVIAQLKALPALPNSASQTSTPIQAVCLPCADEEVDERHFSHLRRVKPTRERALSLSSVASATMDSVTDMFKNLQIVSLFASPNLGLGQPGDGPGLLAGAVPTAETVINGVVQVTPELMALGYTTGKDIIPDHTGIYPPTDRMSILTYWWGLEVLLPPPTLAYLSRVQSISSTVMNFLTALSMMYEGVREILPFVRYLSQYVDFEYNTIKAQDRGKGVVCAATWIMPAAMVPRPWDFPDPPKHVDPPAQTTPPGANAPSVVRTPTVPGQTSTPASPPPSAGEAASHVPLLSPATPTPAPLSPIFAAASA